MKTELEREKEFTFAGYRLDLAARQITTRDGTPLKLNSRAFDALAVLIAHRGETVGKRALLRAVWPDVVVGDNNLNQAIAAIRKALGDSAEPRRIVRTIPGRGFCFVADVDVTDRRSRHTPLDTASRDVIVTVADYF